jgi:formylglycine-generating enzyme required for sulfatase activity
MNDAMVTQPCRDAAHCSSSSTLVAGLPLALSKRSRSFWAGPKLDAEDLKAVSSFLPGKLLGRTAAFLSLVLNVLILAIAANDSLRKFLNIELGVWTTYGMLIGTFLAVVAQAALEWRADRNRRMLQALAVKPGTKQTGYFRIGPYQDTVEDRTKFSRPDRAEAKVLEWIKKSTQVPLYLTGDSGCGKSSLLNAFALPKLRELGWTVVEVRAWQDPQGRLRDELLKLPGARRSKGGKSRRLREMIEEAAKHAPDRLLIVLDQFEEFVILATPERQQELAVFVADLQSRPVQNLAVLLVLRSDYQMLLEEVGLPSLRSGVNLLQLARFQLSAANEFMKRSGLGLQPDQLDRLLASATKLDDTPGLVRPITLNVIGYVLASGKKVAASLDAGDLVRRYIKQTVEQPALRDRAPQMLEQMITEQGTKQPCSEQDLAAQAQLRPAEVRAILNGLCDAGLARPLDSAMAKWELSHDFIAHAVVRFLGRRRGQVARRAAAYAAPALLVISLLGGEAYLRERLRRFATIEPFKREHVTPHVLGAEKEGALRRGESFTECDDDKNCPEMVVVPAGEFMMGSPTPETGSGEGTQHKVVFAKDFAVSKYEVTFGQWDACVAYGDCDPRVGDSFGRGRQPVINVTWDDARRFVDWLSRMTSKRYRLLSEAEWEYASRAGTQMAYSWGDEIGTGNANCLKCGSKWDGRQAAPVGSFAPNQFGLYDMHGNVWEWVEDCYHDNYNGAPTEGSAWAAAAGGDCHRRVLRGGSWLDKPPEIRSAHRLGFARDSRMFHVGFRIGRTLTP